MEGYLRVGKVAKKTGLSPKSIRYYESEKLIPKANRSPTGYRLYPPKVLDRLQFIRKAKTIGFSLADIRRILDLADRGRPCCNQVFQWSERKLQELDEQIQFLTQLRNKIVQYQKLWKNQELSKKATVPEAEICQLIARIELSQERS